jgi:Uma2 family endonuclease
MRSPIHIFSVAEYLEAESKSEVRHEYLGGQIFAMAGGIKAHNIITLNIASRLRSILQENWTMEVLGSEDTLVLNSINLSLTMADIYEDIF